MELPDWGFRQLEVCTDKSVKQTNTIWNVEEHQQNITYRKLLVPDTFVTFCVKGYSYKPGENILGHSWDTSCTSYKGSGMLL